MLCQLQCWFAPPPLLVYLKFTLPELMGRPLVALVNHLCRKIIIQNMTLFYQPWLYLVNRMQFNNFFFNLSFRYFLFYLWGLKFCNNVVTFQNLQFSKPTSLMLNIFTGCLKKLGLRKSLKFGLFFATFFFIVSSYHIQ